MPNNARKRDLRFRRWKLSRKSDNFMFCALINDARNERCERLTRFTLSDTVSYRPSENGHKTGLREALVGGLVESESHNLAGLVHRVVKSVVVSSRLGARLRSSPNWPAKIYFIRKGVNQKLDYVIGVIIVETRRSAIKISNRMKANANVSEEFLISSTQTTVGRGETQWSNKSRLDTPKAVALSSSAKKKWKVFRPDVSEV